MTRVERSNPSEFSFIALLMDEEKNGPHKSNYALGRPSDGEPTTEGCTRVSSDQRDLSRHCQTYYIECLEESVLFARSRPP